MDDSALILQSERSQFRARRSVIRVKNASNPQTFGDLNEHRGVVDIDCLANWRLGDVQRKPKDVRVGLADVNKAGGNNRSTWYTNGQGLSIQPCPYNSRES